MEFFARSNRGRVFGGLIQYGEMEPAGRQNRLMLTTMVVPNLRVTVPLKISGDWDVCGSDVVLVQSS